MTKKTKNPVIRTAKLFWYRIIGLSKKYSLPGFGGASIYDVISLIIQEAMKDDIVTRANSVAFNFFLSLFPTLIFIFTLLPLFPISVDILATLSQNTSGIMPENAHNYLFGMVEDVVTRKRNNLLSIGFILAVFFASSGLSTLMYGFDKSSYKQTFKKRSMVRHRLVAIFLTILLSTVLILSILFIVFGHQLITVQLDNLGWTMMSKWILFMFQWIALIVLFYLIITLIYRYGPAMFRRIPFINPGATLAVILLIVSSMAFAYFVNNFGRYNEIYGSIGALIVLLAWLQINAFILLVGFELNASIAVNKTKIYNKKMQESLNNE